MPINRDKPDRWKEDIALSVDYYNNWFIGFAPKTYRKLRDESIGHVKRVFSLIDNYRAINSEIILKDPSILQTLRMSTCPPIARERLAGLANVNNSVIVSLESPEPQKSNKKRPSPSRIDNVAKICDVIISMLDRDIFVWLDRTSEAKKTEIQRASTIVADRLCSNLFGPQFRTAQADRQMDRLRDWLMDNGYKRAHEVSFKDLQPGSFSLRMIVPIVMPNAYRRDEVGIQVDVVIKPKGGDMSKLLLFIEAKSAGDYTNVNKRRKEEAQKITQLRATYGHDTVYGLFLGGYFDTAYLGYEAAEGIDWIWEHRIDDIKQYGL